VEGINLIWMRKSKNGENFNFKKEIFRKKYSSFKEVLRKLVWIIKN